MDNVTKNEGFHQRLTFLVGMEEPFRWAKRMGIPSATFSRIWTNHDIPKHDHLCRIAERCDISLDWLMMGKGDIASKNLIAVPVTEFANCGIAQGWYNESEVISNLVMPKGLVDKDGFAVSCHGHSMVPAGILDGNVCLVFPNRPVESGKPALIRTRTFVRGKEFSLATIKLFESEDENSVSLSGWLDPDETGYQSQFTEKRLKNCITMIAPVGRVLSIDLPEKEKKAKSNLDVALLAQCLEALTPLYGHMDSVRLSEMAAILYDRASEIGDVNMDTIKSLARIISEKP